MPLAGQGVRPEGPVRRRHVFFFAGFDPKGAGFYHRLWQSEAPAQAEVGGYRIDVGSRRKLPDGNSQWSATAEMAGEAVESVVEFVRWDDLVRAHWPRQPWPLLRDMACSYAYAFRAGMVTSVARLAPKALVAWLYPLAFVLVMSLFGLLLALAGLDLVRTLDAPAWLQGLAVLGISVLVFRLAMAIENRLNTTWLARIFRFASLVARDRVPALEARLDRAAAAIAARLRDPSLDEVLVVGFSVGSILAASAVARARAQVTDGEGSARLSLLTLGHCIPVLACLPEAGRFRRELASLGGDAALVWVDYSSVTDWGSFAQVDPVRACVQDLAAADDRSERHWKSPRFHTLFDPATYVRLRRDKRRMHLQYLLAGQLRGDYDYFALTAGPRGLGRQAP